MISLGIVLTVAGAAVSLIAGIVRSKESDAMQQAIIEKEVRKAVKEATKNK